MSDTPLIYISSSSYSGSTLLAFLLNTHPGLTTISEAEGWDFGDDHDYRCSCGERVPECPFFQQLAQAFSDRGLPFAYRRLGTAFRLAGTERINRLLTGRLPSLPGATELERARDAVLWHLPGPAQTLARQAQANRLLIDTALKHNHARGFVDASKTPHRLRHLRRVEGLDIAVVHLVRDYRAFCQSVRRKWGTPLAVSLRRWVREQQAIFTVSSEFKRVLVLPYEVLCDDPQSAVDAVMHNAGLATAPLPKDFRSVEHHILGNNMRLGHVGAVQCDDRWRQEMTEAERSELEAQAHQLVGDDRLLSPWVRRYRG